MLNVYQQHLVVATAPGVGYVEWPSEPVPPAPPMVYNPVSVPLTNPQMAFGPVTK